MKDRVPTEVLQNGAIRYEEFNASGVSQGYKYLKLADEPTEVGTALNKAFGDVSFFVTYVHTRTGTNNELTNADGGVNIRFVVAADTAASDTWTVNGTTYTLKDQSGETYDAELKEGAVVSCFADNTNHVLNFRSGGAALGYAVVGGTTQPAAPKNNTVWVNTDVSITDRIFAAVQPTLRSDGSALSGGEVWVKEGTASTATMNVAANGDTVMVYPLYAMQYAGGVWTPKAAQSYLGGAWIDWLVYLLHGTDRCVSVTGGWVQETRDEENGIFNAGMPTLTDNADSVTLTGSGGARNHRAIRTANTIDLHLYSKLKIRYTAAISSNTGIKIAVSTSSATYWGGIYTELSAASQQTVATLDISSLTGYYVIDVGTFANAAGGATPSVTIYDYWLEV